MNNGNGSHLVPVVTQNAPPPLAEQLMKMLINLVGRIMQQTGESAFIVESPQFLIKAERRSNKIIVPGIDLSLLNKPKVNKAG